MKQRKLTRLQGNMITLIVYIVVLLFINIFAFPVSKQDLLEQESSYVMSLFEDSVTILERKETDNQSSIFYLVKNSQNQNYLVAAERFWIPGRYRVTEPMSMEEDGIYVRQNFGNRDILIQIENDKMEMRVDNSLSLTMFAIYLWMGIIIIMIIVAYIRQKKS